MKKLIGIFLFLSIVFSSFAQDRFDLFYVAGNYNLMQTTDANPDENGELGIMAQLKIPIVFENNNVWYSQIDYQYFSIFNEYDAATVNPIDKFNVWHYFKNRVYSSIR